MNVHSYVSDVEALFANLKKWLVDLASEVATIDQLQWHNIDFHKLSSVLAGSNGCCPLFGVSMRLPTLLLSLTTTIEREKWRQSER